MLYHIYCIYAVSYLQKNTLPLMQRFEMAPNVVESTLKPTVESELFEKLYLLFALDDNTLV